MRVLIRVLIIMVLSYALFYVRLLNAITELNKFPSFLSCPFLHSDSYSSDIMLLNNMIKEQIKVKLDGNNRCSSLFINVSQNLNIINQHFSNRKNPVLQEEIKEEVLSKQLIQLKLNQMLHDSSDASYQEIEKAILEVESGLYQNEINKKYNQDIFTEKKVNDTLKETFSNLSNVITSLSTAEPQCVDQLGGWEQILPTILKNKNV